MPLLSARGSFKDFAAGCRRLLTVSLFHKRLRFEAVQFGEPLADIRNDRLQQDTMSNATNSHFVSLETEIARKANRLAAAVQKELRSLGHFTDLNGVSLCR